MNRMQRRIQKRRVRRVGVMLASLVMLGATAGLGGAAFAGGTPGVVGGTNRNETHYTENSALFVEGGVYRTHDSTFDGGPAQESYTAVTPGDGASTLAYHGCFLTSNGRTEEHSAPGIEYIC